MNKVACTITLASIALSVPALAQMSPQIRAAVADAGRSAADTSRDAVRKPAEMLAFAGVKPGMTVVDMLPGGGYFTRVFVKTVGPNGKVIALYNSANDERARAAGRDPTIQGQDLKAAYPNVVVVRTPFPTITLPMQADIVWTSNNYHDLHNPTPANVPAINKAAYDALKPGGYYILIDHRAPKGAGLEATSKLHRMDEDVTKQEVMAAGFRLVAEGKDLTRASDDRSKAISEAGGHFETDQFMLKFQKPR